MTSWRILDPRTGTVIGDWSERLDAERMRAQLQASYHRSFSVVKVTT